MLIDQNETRAVVRQIVFKLTIDRALHEDLTQEAFIHLWLREQQWPGQPKGWYFQSCRFFLQNYLRNGRCLHSNRHHHQTLRPAPAGDCVGALADEPVSGDSIPALVSAREIMSLLGMWLTPIERQLLSRLSEGFGVREIAGLLNISHTSAIRCRRRIAALALKLGIEPLPKTNGRRHRSGKGTRFAFRR